MFYDFRYHNPGVLLLVNVIHRLKWTLFHLDRSIPVYFSRVPKRNFITVCFTSTELYYSQCASPELFRETEVDNRIDDAMKKSKNGCYFASCPLPPYTVVCPCWGDAVHWLSCVHDEGNVVGCPADEESQHKGCNDSCTSALLLLLALGVVP